MTKKQQRAALVRLRLLGGLPSKLIDILGFQHLNFAWSCVGFFGRHRDPDYRRLRELGLLEFSVMRPNCKHLLHNDGNPCYRTRLTGLGKRVLRDSFSKR